MLDYERQYWASGLKRVAGIDEAGRGPLAGPVYAAAVIFDPAFAESELSGILNGLTDSKKISENARVTFYHILKESPHVETGLGIAEAEEIDSVNILRATHKAMARAVEALSSPPEYILVDGLPVKGLLQPSTAIVKGDSKSLSIAAASVIAKVSRDFRMQALDKVYPQYGFLNHKGYGTEAHMAALAKYGPCPEHRRSFEPVRSALGLGQQEMDF